VTVPDPTDESELAPPAFVDPGFWRGRRVLVTGATGFKGAWLSRWLTALGAELTGFSLGVPTSPSLYELARVEDGMHSLRGDVRDAESVAAAVASTRPEVVFHMAAQSLVRRSFAEPAVTYATNIMGTVNVLDAVRTHGTNVRVLVNVTSDKCYSSDGHAAAHREHDPIGGNDPYSSSKGAAELVATAYARSFFAGPAATRLVSARAGNVIGGGDWAEDRLVPDVMRAALASQEVQVRNPDAIRPWQHVLGPLSGYLVLAQALWTQDLEETAFNFGPPESEAHTVGSVVKRLSELWPGGIAWKPDERSHSGEVHHLALDSTLARRRLGWQLPIGLGPTLESVVEWYAALRAGQDMREVTAAQIDRFQEALRLSSRMDGPQGGSRTVSH
jgi:CDP-glucose 4,6-dehydratase